MNYRKSMLSASIVAALMFTGSAWAHDAASARQGAQDTSSQDATSAQDSQKTKAEKKKAVELQAVNVVGIRDSEALSLDTKQQADSHVEVVSAIDIGKLPAKNVADTIAQLPGVNIADAAGAEGGFDEADRTSIRGSAPSLALTTLNGHALASGDWFVLAGGTRSVSYSMLPSEIVSQVVVHKTSQAYLLEGGAAGSIDIITRKPLEFAKPFTAEFSIGAVYADLPGKTKPQFNGLVNFRNADSTFGVLVEAFYEERALQRNGQEMLGYSYIPTGSAAATQLGLDAASPGSPSTGVFYPNLPGAVLFTQVRKRKGGSIDVQWRPTDNLTFNLDAFYSKLDASDYNRNYMLRLRDRLPGNTLNNVQLDGNIVTSADMPAQPGLSQGLHDMISRPGEGESSQFYTLDMDWQVSDAFALKFQAGSTHGEGYTPVQDVMEMDTGYGQSTSYTMHGLGTPFDWDMSGSNDSYDASQVGLDWIFGDQGIHVTDKEKWFQADGEVDFASGTLSSLQFGARYAKHTHANPIAIGQGPDWATAVNFTPNSSLWPASTETYPDDFADKLGVGHMPSNIWYWTPAQLADLAKYANRAGSGPASRFYPNDIYSMSEKNTAAYLQANFVGDNWSGNVGLRYVSTSSNVGYTSASILEPDYSGPNMNSPWYPAGWYWNYHKSHYGKVLPSLNFKVNLNSDGSLLARFAASQTLTRQDYGQLTGFVSLADPQAAGVVGGGSGPNAYLKPLVSTNFDASLEWYFSRRGLLSISIYQMNLNDYYDYGTVTRTYLNNYLTYNNGINPDHTPVYSDYLVSVPVNVNGTLQGVELNWVQPIGEHFGTQINYTYANGHSSGGTLLYNADGTFGNNVAAGNRPLFGTSRDTVNVSAYYESDRWNARVNYTYRSAFYDGMMTVQPGILNNTPPLLPYYSAGTGFLSASLGYTFNDHVNLSFSAMNLNNPKLRYYVKGSQAGLGFDKVPEAFYTNGRQYYLNLNIKF